MIATHNQTKMFFLQTNAFNTTRTSTKRNKGGENKRGSKQKKSKWTWIKTKPSVIPSFTRDEEELSEILNVPREREATGHDVTSGYCIILTSFSICRYLSCLSTLTLSCSLTAFYPILSYAFVTRALALFYFILSLPYAFSSFPVNLASFYSFVKPCV